MPWHVLYTEARCEAQALTHATLLCARRGGREDIPKLPLCRSREGEKAVPLFPRYLFVRLVSPALSWAEFAALPGVVDWVRFEAERIAAVPDGLVEEILARASADGGAVILRSRRGGRRFEKGQPVRVSEGPFAGHVGLYAGSAQARIILLLDMLGRHVRVKLSESAAQAVS